MRIDEIRPYERNARHNEMAVPKVAESIKEWSKIKQKMDLAGVKYLDKSEYINTRE